MMPRNSNGDLLLRQMTNAQLVWYWTATAGRYLAEYDRLANKQLHEHLYHFAVDAIWWAEWHLVRAVRERRNAEVSHA